MPDNDSDNGNETTPAPPPEQNPQREQKMKTLQTSLSTLHAHIIQLEDEISGIRGKLQQDPSVTVKRHIRLLHEYNEIKDVGQGLMGLIADARGVRQVEVQREFGVAQAD